MKTRSMLTLEDCTTIMKAAQAEARANSWIVSIAILDDGGHLLAFERMDGATPASAAIATEKGRTAAISRRSSGMWEELIKGGRTAMLKMPNLLPVQGGMPILVEGNCIGAVGVSGVQSQQDEQIATAGINALLKK